MAVNKNFVVKNGLEVNTNLLLADADNSRVGVGTSVPSFTLHVFGGIGVTDVSVTGVTTLSQDLKVGSGGTGFVVTTDSATGAGQSVGIRTGFPEYTLDVRGPVSTGTRHCMFMVIPESLVTCLLMTSHLMMPTCRTSRSLIH